MEAIMRRCRVVIEGIGPHKYTHFLDSDSSYMVKVEDDLIYCYKPIECPGSGDKFSPGALETIFRVPTELAVVKFLPPKQSA